MADTVDVEQNSTASDDYQESIIQTITFTADGDMTMIKTSNSPVKVEILQHANGFNEHLNPYPEMVTDASSSCVDVDEPAKGHQCSGSKGNTTEEPGTSSQCDQDPNCSVITTKMERIPRFVLNGREIVPIPDIYRAVRNIWRAQGSLQRLMSKLEILVMRFLPRELIAMKQRGLINLTVKCCSYILASDFERITEKFDETYGTQHRENIQFLPLVDVDKPVTAPPSRPSTSVKAQSSITDNKPPMVFKMQTFLLNTGQTVISTYEMQGLFELHFHNPELFNHCLFNLGICQDKFTDPELKELRDFVSISDEVKLDLSRSYISVEDAEKVVHYATTLLNASKPEISWIGPLKLVNGEEDGMCMDGTFSIGPEDGESSQDCQDDAVISSVKENSHGIMLEVSPKIFEHTKNGKEASLKSFESERREGPSLPNEITQNNTSSSCFASTNTTGLGTLGGTHNCSNQSVTDSSLTSASNASPVQPGVTVRTFLTDGQVVVCIPDVHKLVIQLYSQSVQVGYYMQRLDISPQRFSCTHVKHLKAYNVLSSKATVCTFITKPEAERVLQMYDLPYTTSRLHEVHWAEPIVLGDELTVQTICKEAVQEDREVQEDEDNLQEPVTIPTFEIDGEVVVSVPDAHRAVQVLNGQSVQLRYNLDKLGIPKYKFSYSQVHQMKACSGLKRPSMCTFISKHDAERLLLFYASHGNASRLKLIQWLPPVKLGSDEETTPVKGNTPVADHPQLCPGENVNETTGVVPDLHSTCAGSSKSHHVPPTHCNSSSRPHPPSPDHQTFDITTSQAQPTGSHDAHVLSNSTPVATPVTAAPNQCSYYCSSYTAGDRHTSLCMCISCGSHYPVGVQTKCSSNKTGLPALLSVDSSGSPSCRGAAQSPSVMCATEGQSRFMFKLDLCAFFLIAKKVMNPSTQECVPL